MSILLGCVLAAGTWITLTTMFPHEMAGDLGGDQAVDGGIVQNFARRDPILFLEICLTENWLIFITRANGPFWSSLPSWQLAGAILVVDNCNPQTHAELARICAGNAQAFFGLESTLKAAHAAAAA